MEQKPAWEDIWEECPQCKGEGFEEIEVDGQRQPKKCLLCDGEGGRMPDDFEDD